MSKPRIAAGIAKRLPRGVLLDLPGGHYYLLKEDCQISADGYLSPVYTADADSNLIDAGVIYGTKGAALSIVIRGDLPVRYECSLVKFREMLHGHGHGVECALYAGRGSLGTG